MEPKVCVVSECTEVQSCKGLCRRHYNRWRRTGSTESEQERRKSLHGGARVLERITHDGDHWLAPGATTKDGYCQTTHNGVRMYAHRAVYEYLVGPIPEGLTVDHTCETKRCVNPAHLEPCSQPENAHRFHARRKAAA